ncbi:MAG: class I SAM-dependent methyltransferase [Candidatus Saliniplasma sp.]
MSRIFDRYAEEYDVWFDKNEEVFRSEIEAVKRFIPERKDGIEVGVGSGRFASQLSIEIGIDSSLSMLRIAKSRGVEVLLAKAEDLPFDDSSFDFVLMVTTLCFLEESLKAISESKRVLKDDGRIIIGMIDKDSFLGRKYESNKQESIFYKDADFYSIEGVIDMLQGSGFEQIKTVQTLFKDIDQIGSVEEIKEGYGEGGFVVLSAVKTN